jgi:cytochrome c553
MLFKKTLTLIILTSVFAWGSTETRYNNECGICHGKDGTKKAMGKSKEIRGMTVEEIEKAMYDYASKRRPSMSMIQSMKKSFVNANSKETLRNIAVYINKL